MRCLSRSLLSIRLSVLSRAFDDVDDDVIAPHPPARACTRREALSETEIRRRRPREDTEVIDSTVDPCRSSLGNDAVPESDGELGESGPTLPPPPLPPASPASRLARAVRARRGLATGGTWRKSDWCGGLLVRDEQKEVAQEGASSGERSVKSVSRSMSLSSSSFGKLIVDEERADETISDVISCG